MTRLAFMGSVALLAACVGPPTGRSRVQGYRETIPGTKVFITMVPVPETDVWLSRTEVTWAQYEAYYLSEETDAVARPSPSYPPHDRGWGAGQRPAVGISRQAAQRYCEWLSGKTGHHYRLPTEAEWLHACGPDPEPLAKYACFNAKKPCRVGAKQANGIGLHDMLGNVWEYCAGADVVLLGGCWKDKTVSRLGRRILGEDEWNESDPQLPKSVWWLADGPYVGFRLARSTE